MSSSESTSVMLPSRGKFCSILWSIVFVLGAAGWLACVLYGDTPRAWRAMLINFIFFTPLASGMIVWPAIAVISQGIWARPLQRYAFAALAFAPVSITAFIILWIGYPHWASWSIVPGLPQGFWLTPTFLFTRDIIALIIIWLLAALFVTRAQKVISSKLAGWLCFTYAVVFTLIAFDMVMALDPHWFSTLFGGYFFVTGMYAALAAWTLLSICSGTANAENRHDFAKLLIAVSLLTTYLMYSQLLPIWYTNFPHEVRFILPRLTITNWPYISAALLVTIYLGPLVLLLTRWSKRSPAFLAFVSLLMLAGLWVERWWEVTPTLGGKLTFGLTEISITAAFIASFIISVKIFTGRQKY